MCTIQVVVVLSMACRQVAVHVVGLDRIPMTLQATKESLTIAQLACVDCRNIISPMFVMENHFYYVNSSSMNLASGRAKHASGFAQQMIQIML